LRRRFDQLMALGFRSPGDIESRELVGRAYRPGIAVVQTRLATCRAKHGDTTLSAGGVSKCRVSTEERIGMMIFAIRLWPSSGLVQSCGVSMRWATSSASARSQWPPRSDQPAVDFYFQLRRWTRLLNN
jgi:hypothetical protein